MKWRHRRYWQTAWRLWHKRRKMGQRPRQLQYTRFLILCAPRSGSTLLHTYLNSHSQILSEGEWLRRQYQHDLQAALPSPYLALFHPQAPWVQAVGLKVFYEHLESRIYQAAVEELADDKALKVLHIRRQDVLRQYISEQISLKTGRWNAAEKPLPLAERQITFDPDRFQQYQLMQEHDEIRALAAFDDQERYALTYEGLVANPEQVLGEVQHFLGVVPQPLITALRPQNPEPIGHLVTNPEDLPR